MTRMSRYFLFTFYLLSYLIGQTTYEFEIIPLPEMDTPLRMKGDGSAIVGTNYSGMALYWTDSTGVQVLGTGELWGISENDRIFAELANDNGNWEAALIEDGETTFLGNVEGGNIAATPMVNWGSAQSSKYLRIVFSNEPAERLHGIGKQFMDVFN